MYRTGRSGRFTEAARNGLSIGSQEYGSHSSPMVLRSSRWPLRGHERLQSRPWMHVHVVVRFGYLECIGPPRGGSAYRLEPVRTAESGEPRGAER